MGCFLVYCYCACCLFPVFFFFLGCPPQAIDKYGRTVAHNYLQNNHFILLKYILTPSHSISTSLASFYLQHADLNGTTLLLDSCTSSHNQSMDDSRLDILSFLLARGANPLTEQTKKGLTIVHKAATLGCTTILALLIQHYQYAHDTTPAIALTHILNVEDKAQRTPLHGACEHGQTEIVRMLVTHGATIRKKDQAGWTPLHFACLVSK